MNRNDQPAAVTDTRELILRTAEDLLRRQGVAKAKVVEVARHLKMSHGNVYRHFASKVEMQDAVVARWLAGITAPLEKYVHTRDSAERRLRGWISRFVAIKLEKVEQDPELFATYAALADESQSLIEAHILHLRKQLETIIADGVERGEFKVNDVKAAAQGVHEGITRFQHPYFVLRAQDRNSSGVKVVTEFLIAGLKAGVA